MVKDILHDCSIVSFLHSILRLSDSCHRQELISWPRSKGFQSSVVTEACLQDSSTTRTTNHVVTRGGGGHRTCNLARVCRNRALSALTLAAPRPLFDLFNNRFQALEEIKVKTEGTKREAFTKALRESVASLLKKASKHRLTVSAIGVGCAGSINAQKGVVNSAPNIPALDG